MELRRAKDHGQHVLAKRQQLEEEVENLSSWCTRRNNAVAAFHTAPLPTAGQHRQNRSLRRETAEQSLEACFPEEAFFAEEVDALNNPLPVPPRRARSSLSVL